MSSGSEECPPDPKRPRTSVSGEPPLECAICLHSELDRPLRPHGCGTCAPDAWRVCDDCERNLVSRSCPMCQGDYRALELFAYQRLEDAVLEGRELSEKQRFVCRKVCFLGRLEMLTFSNTLIWHPAERVLHFSLPVDTTVEPSTIEYLRARLRVDDATEALLREGRFHFTNKVWDAIVAADSGETEATVLPLAAASPQPPQQLSSVSIDTPEVAAAPALSPHLEAGDEGTDEGEEDGSDDGEVADSSEKCVGSRALIAWALGELAKPGAALFTSQDKESISLLIESTLEELEESDRGVVTAKSS